MAAAVQSTPMAQTFYAADTVPTFEGRATFYHTDAEKMSGDNFFFSFPAQGTVRDYSAHTVIAARPQTVYSRADGQFFQSPRAGQAWEGSGEVYGHSRGTSTARPQTAIPRARNPARQRPHMAKTARQTTKASIGHGYDKTIPRDYNKHTWAFPELHKDGDPCKRCVDPPVMISQYEFKDHGTYKGQNRFRMKEAPKPPEVNKRSDIHLRVTTRPDKDTRRAYFGKFQPHPAIYIE